MLQHKVWVNTHTKRKCLGSVVPPAHYKTRERKKRGREERRDGRKGEERGRKGKKGRKEDQEGGLEE